MPASIVFDEKQVYNLFVVQGLTKVKTAEILGINRKTLTTYINENGWKQSDEAVKKNRARPNKYKINLDKNLLVELYINQNLTVEETAAQLGVNESAVRKRLMEFGISKTKEARIENAKRKFLENHPDGWADQEFRQKIEDSCVAKYGVKYPSQNLEIKEKIRETCRKNFGVDCSLQNEKVREKGVLKMLSKYGCKHPMESQEIKDRVKQTCLKNFGVENPAMSQEITDKKLRTFFKNRNNDKVDYILEVIKTSESFRNFIVTNNFTTTKQIADALNYSLCPIERYLTIYRCWDLIKHYKSAMEIEVKTFLDECGILTISTRDIISPYEIDMYSDTYKIGIEFNGNYWHCDLEKAVDYHQMKSLMAKEAGVDLIHIYEYEWNDSRRQPIIKSILKSAFGVLDKNISAVKCIIKPIVLEDAKVFCEANYLYDISMFDIGYGLFYNDELVEILCFKKADVNNNWKIVNDCCLINCCVDGGFKKLFKHFIQTIGPNCIYCDCDYNKYNGQIYENAGMAYIGLSDPDKKWIIDTQVFSDTYVQDNNFQEVAEARIFGSGFKKYLWTNIK